jgi:hypothetical protein
VNLGYQDGLTRDKAQRVIGAAAGKALQLLTGWSPSSRFGAGVSLRACPSERDATCAVLRRDGQAMASPPSGVPGLASLI